MSGQIPIKSLRAGISGFAILDNNVVEHALELLADDLESGEWYRRNEWWWRPIKEKDEAFRAYYAAQYGNRSRA